MQIAIIKLTSCLFQQQQNTVVIILVVINAFLTLFWVHVRQPDNHIDALCIYSTNPRTNLWNFCEKILIIGGVEKLSFCESAILTSHFFFASSPWKSVEIYRLAWDQILMITLVFSPKYPLPSNLHTTVDVLIYSKFPNILQAFHVTVS